MELLPSRFDSLLGTEILESTPQRVRLSLRITEDHLQPAGLVHGGVYATLAETAASIGASVNVLEREIGAAAVGLDNHTTFLRAVGAGATVSVEAVPHHAGRQTQLWSVSIRDERGRELALSLIRLHVVQGGDHLGPVIA